MMFRLVPIFVAFAVVCMPALQPVRAAASIAIDKGRAQLLNDALGWMTFRKNGVLMSSEELLSLFKDVLKEKYVKSKLYRTFVIAFHLGVLPKLTLQENQPCDPTYSSQFKDPRNNSVTWYYQKEFTFDLYAKRDSTSLQLCDYRQGLVCNKQTKKCQCPEGASLSPIDQGSSVKRCLMKQDQLCGLIDIEHGNDPKHTELAAHLYHMVFNLEKPLGCQPGTQCRFKDPAFDSPRCYASGPFFPPPPKCNPSGTSCNYETFNRKLGDECAIGLYANPGSCEENGGVGIFDKLVCYNFGPSRAFPNAVDTGREGFCGSYFGSFGISNSGSSVNGQYSYNPLFIPFVHPRTVPYRRELKQYYNTFVFKVMQYMHPHNSGGYYAMVVNVGDACSVAKTEQFEKAWQYYAGLEGPPAPGSDYVSEATPTELEAKLKEVVDFKSSGSKVCKVFFHYYRSEPNSYLYETEGLKCVKEGTPDAEGNDGKCQKPGNLEAETKKFAKRLQDVIDGVSKITFALKYEEQRYDNEILKENPEPPCALELVPLPEARSVVVDALEGGFCPDGSVCYEDFSDARGIYDSDCELETDATQRFVCHDITQPLDKCEGEYLNSKVDQLILYQDKFGKRKKGEKCYPKFESLVRSSDTGSLLGTFNSYQILNWLNRGTLCDRKEGNLECTTQETCECIGGKCTDMSQGNNSTGSVVVVKPGEPGEPGESTTTDLSSGASKRLIVSGELSVSVVVLLMCR